MLKPEVPPPYSPGEVAAIFGVDPKTVRRWTLAGRLPYLTTLGGHHRHSRAAIDALAEARTQGVAS
jgi:excisionase family DNA binding protein